MDAFSAPGPDGFTGSFFLHCWDIIKEDLTEAIHAFFQGLQLPRIISATALVLLPKVPNASKLNELRPISLCNFVHKVISRILNDRLLTVLPKIISPEQAGFLPGRSIHENMALAHDLVNDLHNDTVRAGNIVMKIDMSKAYDRVSWHFLLLAFEALGFDPRWTDMIYRNLSNCWYNIRWDGGVYGFFKSHQGVRQGDPLSPSLFILSMEVFSRQLNRAVSQRRIVPYYSARYTMVINQLLYADDMLIFSNGDIDSVKHLLGIIQSFCKSSGQILNEEKSSIFLSKKINVARKHTLLSQTRFREGHLPTNYLGGPLFNGRAKVEYYDDLVGKILSRIQGWMTTIVSIGGRSTLIQSVLNSIPIHTMAAIPVPNSVLNRIESHLASFLWDEGSEKRRHWVAWHATCKPKREGGLGFRSLASTLDGLQAKLAWSYICQSSLWAKYMRSKYEGYSRRGSSSWRSINKHVPRIRQQAVWVFGNGETKVGKVLEVYDIVPAPDIRNSSVAELEESGRLSKLMDILPVHAKDAVDYTPGNIQDKIVWAYTSSGNFCIKTYLRLNHNRAQSLLSHVWHAWIPPKISIFAWRVGKGAISTDDRVKSLGIQLASKCTCCLSPKCETLEHLFIHGDVARLVWDHFSKACRKPMAQSIFQLFKFWASDPNPKTQFGAVSISIFLWSLWEIWKLRNKARHDGTSSDIVRIIQHNVNSHMEYTCPQIKASSIERTALQYLRMKIKDTIYNPSSWVAWAPGTGITANFIVSSDAKKGSAILRDPLGLFISGFITEFETRCRASNLLLLLTEALGCCASRGISITDIQVSDKNVARWLRCPKSMCPWPMTNLFRRCKEAAGNARFMLIPKAVNNCAKKMLQGNPGWVNDMEKLPREVRASLHLEATKVPYFVRGRGLHQI